MAVQITRESDNYMFDNELAAFDDRSSVSTQRLLPVFESDKKEHKVENPAVRICRIKVNERESQPFINIKFYCRPKDDLKDLLTKTKKYSLDKHIKVSRVKHSDLQELNARLATLKLEYREKQKQIEYFHGYRHGKMYHENTTADLLNHRFIKLTPRSNTVPSNNFSHMNDHIRYHPNKNQTPGKSNVGRQPLHMFQKQLLAPVLPASENFKKQ